MKARFLADANFNYRIVRGLRRREPLVDFQTAEEAGLAGRSDADVLEIAATEQRVLVTHDRKTMPTTFRLFISRKQSAGVIIVSQNLPIGIAIEELLLIWAATESEEWIDTISTIPW